MKRGLLKSYFDTNSIKILPKDFISTKNRRPSRIEERIRLRRLRNNPHLMVKSPEQITEASENITAESRVIKNSCDSSSPRTESYTTSATSCSSSSNENMPKIRGSKQRVDLLELGASSRTPLVNMRLKKSRGKSKNPGKLFMFHQGKLKAKTRPRSAPCTPLFELKYSQQNWGRDNFVDYKIVEKDCIDQPQTLDDDTVDCEPVGNPALIAVMTESLDKMRAELNANKNSCAVDEEIDGDFVSRKSSILNANSAGNSLPNSVADSEGVLLEKQESQSRLEIPRISSENENSEVVHEIHLDSNNYGSCTVIEESTATSQSRYNNCNCTVSNPASGPGSSCTNDNLLSLKNSPGKKCYKNRWETSLLEKRPSSKPCGAQDTLQIRDDRDAEIPFHKTVACTHQSEDCQLHRSHNYCIRRNFNHQSTVNETLKPWGNSKKDLCPCSVQRAGDKSNSFSLANNSISESCGTHCGADCCVRNYQLKIPQQQCANNNFAMSKQESVKLPNSGMTRSCDCHAVKRSCRKICGSQRSKSSPRKVTFRLPSLIPEEGIIQNFEEDNKETNFRQICNRKFSNIEPNRKSELSEPQNEKNEFKKNRDTISASYCNSSHSHCRSCCMGYQQRRSRSPKVHFCKEHSNKQQEIVGDFCKSGAGHREIESTNKLSTEEAQPVKNSDSKTSFGSEKDAWAEDKEDQNILDNFENISFPKETRQAMNVLLQSRENRSANPLNGSISGKQRRQQNQEIQVLNKPDLGIFDSEGQKAMHVATYAQALAVFQRKSDFLAGGSCKKKRNIVWKGSDGEIHSEYTEASELTLQKLVKRSENRNRRRNRYQSCFDFIRSLDQNFESRILNCPGQHTGFKMQTNGGGSENGSAENGVDRTGWTVGLINGRFKYLTAETFGFKINANGASLKKKQLWTLEGSEHQVFLRSHLDRYLAVDQFGNVTCEAEDTADPGCAFQIQVAADGSGRWALKNIQRGYFLGSSQDELKCTAKVPADAEYWLVHLAARPQVNLRSAGRKRFAHLSAAQDEIHVDAPVPWGEDTLFTLEFRPAAMPDAVDGNSDSRREVRSEAGIGGHYALHTCNNKYLARDGKLLDSCTRDCLYAAEFHAGMLALRDVSGAYLAPIGSKAVLKSRSNTVTRDELFSLEDSLPQASFVAALNQRYVSVKQGVDVTANQDEISGHETFQLEFDRATKRWYLRTMQDRYWTLEAGGGIQASDHKRSSNALFDLVWQPADGTVALRANNGKFLATKRSGHLYANADAAGDSEASKFHFYLMNRPVLVLRCEQGFVGLKSNASPKLECNKASYETIRVERCDRGIVRFKGQNGKYWHADSEGVTSDADVPADGFYLELREPSRICIKSTDGRYLSAGKNGVFRLGDTDYESATKWEF